MSTKKILVIEDNQKHLADAKAFFADKPEYEVEYATNGSQAMELVQYHPGTTLYHPVSKATQFQFVITDLYMPLDEHHKDEQPIGLGIAMLCRLQGVRCVICTAGHHHGSRYEWIHRLSGGANFPMVDSSSEREMEADTKKWHEAVETAEGRLGCWGWSHWSKTKS